MVGLWIGPKYNRHVLPAFDGHVYDSIAESPQIFTLPPWGYRILEPWIVHFIPARSNAEGFYWLNLCLLAGSVYIVGSWLRRLGFSSEGAALAAAALAISPPVLTQLDYQVLVDPLALLLLVLALRELVSPDLLVLMALAAAAALTKETSLLLLILVPIALIPRFGWKRGLLDAAMVSLPALTLMIVLRLIWGNPIPAAHRSIWNLSLERLVNSAAALSLAALLSGLTVIAAVGLFREKSIELRAFGVLMWIFTFGLIVSNPYQYSVADLPRLSLFAWPPLLPLALSGLGFKRAPPSPIGGASKRWRAVPAIALLLVCCALVAATDPYQRAPFEANPNPVALAGRLRETLKTARLLDQGGTFVFDARSGRFAEPIREAFNLTEGRRQRWFLYNGFGPDAAFGSGAPELRHNAELIVPILNPRDMVMTFEVAGQSYIPIFISHRQVGEIFGGRGAQTIRIGANDLVRGDNIVRLETYTDDAIRILRFEVSLQPES